MSIQSGINTLIGIFATANKLRGQETKQTEVSSPEVETEKEEKKVSPKNSTPKLPYKVPENMKTDETGTLDKVMRSSVISTNRAQGIILSKKLQRDKIRKSIEFAHKLKLEKEETRKAVL